MSNEFTDDELNRLRLLADAGPIWTEIVRKVSALQSCQVSMARAYGQSFQHRVVTWALDCFQRCDSMQIEQRSFRFVEEALELSQAAGTSEEDILRLVGYVFTRPVGEVEQEIGGVMVTLAALAFAAGRQMDGCGEVELLRCIANTEKIRAKDLAKPERSPLPGLPQPTEVKS